MPQITYQKADAQALEPVLEIERLCARHASPAGALALQFSMRDPRITSTIVGVSKPERVTETLAWAKQTISDDTWKDLESLPFSSEDPEANRDYKPG